MPMIFQLHQPFALNELGRRANNEDSVFPKKGFATAQDRAFIVCDGVGGQAKGEIASKIVSEIFGEALRHTKASEQHYIEAVLQQIEDELQQYTQTHAESAGMATTLTMIHFHENGVSVAHVGDSRIYQIRDGQIIYKSADHSFVNELVQAGVITPEQAVTHPQRNVITRAIQGNEKRTSPDVYILQNVAPNDYFFLCTDGVLESVNDVTLLDILTNPYSNEEKIVEILRLCEAKSRDNFSCYLIQVEDCHGGSNTAYDQPSFVHAPVAAAIPITQTTAFDDNYEEPATGFYPKYVPPPQYEPEIPPQTHVPQNTYENVVANPVEATQIPVVEKRNSSLKWVIGSLFFMAIAGGGTWYFLQQNKVETPPPAPVQTIENTISQEPQQLPMSVDTPIVNTVIETPIAPVVTEKAKPVESHSTKNKENKDNKEKKEEKKPEIKPENKAELKPKEEKRETIPEIKKEIKEEEKKEPNLQNDENDEPLGNHTKPSKAENPNIKTITTKTSQAINKKEKNR
jgi:serine/threonine protein phosphatase PrpC